VVPDVSKESNDFMSKGKNLPSYSGPLDPSRRGQYHLSQSATTHLTQRHTVELLNPRSLKFLSQNKFTSIFIQIRKRTTVQMLRSAKDGLDRKVPRVYRISCVSAAECI
jgi:hypothetical protein